jgi:hypothetical protein
VVFLALRRLTRGDSESVSACRGIEDLDLRHGSAFGYD